MAGVSANPNDHVLHEIQDRHRYILGGCVEDLWLAVSTLPEIFPVVAGQVAYSGVSFGGGIGALVVPWDARVGRGAPAGADFWPPGAAPDPPLYRQR